MEGFGIYRWVQSNRFPLEGRSRLWKLCCLTCLILYLFSFHVSGYVRDGGGKEAGGEIEGGDVEDVGSVSNRKGFRPEVDE